MKYSTFVNNQAVGGDCHRQLGGFGLGGALWNDGTADLDHVSFSGNRAVGGATRNSNDKWLGGAAFGGAVSSANAGTLTVGNCSFTRNKAIGGAVGGEGLGGGYAVGSCVIFGKPDTSSVKLDGGSVVRENKPDDSFSF